MPIATEPFVTVPFSPPKPEDLYFSNGENAWILSRHQDVVNVLRSSDVSQIRPPTPDVDPRVKPKPEKRSFVEANNRTYSEGFATLANSSKGQIYINALVSTASEYLPRHHSVDLVSQFIQPWCLASAIALMDLDPNHSELVAELVKHFCDADAAPHDVDLKLRAKEANQELDCLFPPPSASHAKSMFLGIAQTTPYFLASAWAALLPQRSEMKQLQKCSGCIPKATEELLRYAGPVHTVFRLADRDLTISGTNIECGDRLILRLQSANRDPEQFPEPDRLNFARDVAGHVALSSGSHYCAGASLVRTMTTMALQAILTRYSEPRLCQPVEWRCGTMLIWPSSLPVLLGNAL